MLHVYSRHLHLLGVVSNGNLRPQHWTPVLQLAEDGLHGGGEGGVHGGMAREQETVNNIVHEGAGPQGQWGRRGRGRR